MFECFLIVGLRMGWERRGPQMGQATRAGFTARTGHSDQGQNPVIKHSIEFVLDDCGWVGYPPHPSLSPKSDFWGIGDFEGFAREQMSESARWAVHFQWKRDITIAANTSKGGLTRLTLQGSVTRCGQSRLPCLLLMP